jgi:hypothetical protein
MRLANGLGRGWRHGGWLTTGLMALAVSLAGACGDSGAADPDPDPESTYGIEGELATSGPVGKADNAGVPGMPVSVEGSSTQVWEVRNQWEDTDTPEAREAGIAWEADSGLTWDEKYIAWVQSMEKIDGYETYYETFELTTPWAKTVPAPKLECAEIAIFLRITFASWYGLPFYITAVDGNGDRVYFGHFGARTRAGRYKNTPLYKSWYADYSHMTAEELQAQGWPKDEKLRARGLYGGGDDMDYIFEGSKAGGYFDEIFLNKRTGHFMRLVLAYFGSIHLASSRNTYNIKPQAVEAGDVLLERWQRTGIGHTLVVKQVTPLEQGRLEAQLVSGSMPRRQPKWEDGAASKRYFTSEECGGEGTNYDGEEYVKLGGGIKRWRVAKNIDGYWTNTWMSADEASWICDTDYERLKVRPSQFEDILGEVDPADLRDALVRMIDDARNHLRQYPASCAARIRREDAFEELYQLNETEFGLSRAETDAQYRILEDYVFAQLVYEESKTCCWCTSTSAMHQIIMDYNEERMAQGCQEPVVFKAMGGGYSVFQQYAEETGRGHLWRAWSEDEPCPQRDTDNDVEEEHDWIPWCEASEGGTTPPPSCEDDTYEPNDNPNEAADLGEGTFQGLVICEGNDDYFTMEAASGLTVRIEFSHADGDLDMELYQAGERLDISQSTDDMEEISVTGGGQYTLRVYGYNSAENSYTLTTVAD